MRFRPRTAKQGFQQVDEASFFRGFGVDTDLAVHSVVQAKMQHVGTRRRIQRVELRLQAVWQQVANVVLGVHPCTVWFLRAPGSRRPTIPLPAWWKPPPNPGAPANGPNRRLLARPLPAPAAGRLAGVRARLRFGCSTACLPSRPWAVALGGRRTQPTSPPRPPTCSWGASLV